MADIEIIDNSGKVLEELDTAGEAALEAVGQQAVSHAKKNITEAGRVDTGASRNSISHAVVRKEKAVYIGTKTRFRIDRGGAACKF